MAQVLPDNDDSDFLLDDDIIINTLQDNDIDIDTIAKMEWSSILPSNINDKNIPLPMNTALDPEPPPSDHISNEVSKLMCLKIVSYDEYATDTHLHSTELFDDINDDDICHLTHIDNFPTTHTMSSHDIATSINTLTTSSTSQSPSCTF